MPVVPTPFSDEIQAGSDVKIEQAVSSASRANPSRTPCTRCPYRDTICLRMTRRHRSTDLRPCSRHVRADGLMRCTPRGSASDVSRRTPSVWCAAVVSAIVHLGPCLISCHRACGTVVVVPDSLRSPRFRASISSTSCGVRSDGRFRGVWPPAEFDPRRRPSKKSTETRRSLIS